MQMSHQLNSALLVALNLWGQRRVHCRGGLAVLLPHVDDGGQVLAPFTFGPLQELQGCVQAARAEQAVRLFERYFWSDGAVCLDKLQGIGVPAQHDLGIELRLQRILVPFRSRQNCKNDPRLSLACQLTWLARSTWCHHPDIATTAFSHLPAPKQRGRGLKKSSVH